MKEDFRMKHSLMDLVGLFLYCLAFSLAMALGIFLVGGSLFLVQALPWK
jgi:hypothetical protein